MTDLAPAGSAFPRDALVGQARTYGARLAVNPYTGLLDEVQWRAGHVAWLRDRLQAMSPDELWVLDDRGNLRDSPTLRRYDKERELFDRACKLAVEAGIAERYVQLAELQGATLHRLLTRTLDELEATAALGDLPPDLRARFGAALRRAFEQERLASGTRTDVLDAASSPAPLPGPPGPPGPPR